MPGAAEPVKSRAQPGSLDLIEANSAEHTSRHLKATPSWQRRKATPQGNIVRQLSAVVMAARLPVDR